MILSEFNQAQIRCYIEKYVNCKQITGWSADKYRKEFNEIKELKKLNSNPFMLYNILEVLLEMNVEINNKYKLTRI